MIRLIGKEAIAARLGFDIASADILALIGGEAFAEATRRHDAIELDLGDIRDQVADALGADLQPIDLFKAARAIGKEALPRFLVGGEGIGTFVVPGLAVDLPRHIGQRIDAVLGP